MWHAQNNFQQYIYRSSKNLDLDLYSDYLDRIISTNRFVIDKAFSGARSQLNSEFLYRSSSTQQRQFECTNKATPTVLQRHRTIQQ
uniref:Uncharacterized protein n=1 Tax=Onchocerca volvulus TaxID=6282 RepID=A0A8R1XL45_ONCVO